MNLYCVYYKLPQADHSHWAQRVRGFAAQLRERFPQLGISLLQRPDVNAGGLETWMEVYQHPQGLNQDMIEAIEEEAVQLQLPAKRATEFFVDLRD